VRRRFRRPRGSGDWSFNISHRLSSRRRRAQCLRAESTKDQNGHPGAGKQVRPARRPALPEGSSPPRPPQAKGKASRLTILPAAAHHGVRAVQLRKRVPARGCAGSAMSPDPIPAGASAGAAGTAGRPAPLDPAGGSTGNVAGPFWARAASPARANAGQAPTTRPGPDCHYDPCRSTTTDPRRLPGRGARTAPLCLPSSLYVPRPVPEPAPRFNTGPDTGWYSMDSLGAALKQKKKLRLTTAANRRPPHAPILRDDRRVPSRTALLGPSPINRPPNEEKPESSKAG